MCTQTIYDIEERDMSTIQQNDALLRERESAKAAVTDETAISFFRDIYGSETYPSAKTTKAFRDALEAVAPMLARAAVTDNPTEEMLIAARDWSYRKYGKPIGNDAAIGCWQAMLAAATKPETEE